MPPFGSVNHRPPEAAQGPGLPSDLCSTGTQAGAVKGPNLGSCRRAGTHQAPGEEGTVCSQVTQHLEFTCSVLFSQLLCDGERGLRRTGMSPDTNTPPQSWLTRQGPRQGPRRGFSPPQGECCSQLQRKAALARQSHAWLARAEMAAPRTKGTPQSWAQPERSGKLCVCAFGPLSERFQGSQQQVVTAVGRSAREGHLPLQQRKGLF